MSESEREIFPGNGSWGRHGAQSGGAHGEDVGNGNGARVVVVGAGLAGLTAARGLKRAGVDVAVYEASQRIGGRIRSASDLFGSGLTIELGGEFIDSGHTHLLELARDYALPLIDTQSASEQGLDVAYHFDGEHRSEQLVIQEFKPVAARIRADLERLSPEISAARHSPADAELDRMSIAEYLERIDAAGWLRKLLDVGYTSEFGAEVAEQSCLNLLTMLSPDTSNAFRIFGESDERYKILGGNDLVAKALAAELGGRIEPDCRLVAVRDRGTGYRLEFACGSGAKSVDADFVVLAIPFAVLREVELPPTLPPQKRHAIDRLGYGTNEKLIVGLHAPIWRDHGFDGGMYSDQPFQTGWDAGREQQGAGAAYTFFLGGHAGADLTASPPDAMAARYLQAADPLFPGLQDAYAGTCVATDWRVNPFSRGSYSFYKPGQWTSIAGWERRPVGNLYFAGEHCSTSFQGYMNGAVETGHQAAEAIVGRLKRN
jgi:monoamine oxidase